MAAALRTAEAQNRRLSQQILTIAEEERADIARDLHDEIGPLLFAITTFTAAIGRQVETGDLAPVPGQLQAIQDATARLQREVRDMLGRLHEGEQAPADLPAALGELLAFWRSVRPGNRIHAAKYVALPAAFRCGAGMPVPRGTGRHQQCRAAWPATQRHCARQRAAGPRRARSAG